MPQPSFEELLRPLIILLQILFDDCQRTSFLCQCFGFLAILRAVGITPAKVVGEPKYQRTKQYSMIPSSLFLIIKMVAAHSTAFHYLFPIFVDVTTVQECGLFDFTQKQVSKGYFCQECKKTIAYPRKLFGFY